MATLKVPKFATEAEEAQWWFEHQGELADAFDDAAAKGEIRRGEALNAEEEKLAR